MAFADHYVLPVAAGLADGTSWDNAFDLAGSQAHAVGKVGQRYNLKGDFGTIAAGTWTTGDYQQPNVWRGCENEPGDLDNRKRNADGTLNVTGYPIFTLSANVQNYGTVNTTFQNIYFTANINSYMTTSGTDDRVTFINCKIENVNTGSAARILNIDDAWLFINCDIICNGSGTQTIGTGDVTNNFIKCRFECKTAGSSAFFSIQNNTRIDGCTFIGNGSNIAISNDTATSALVFLTNNTFYNLSSALQCTLAHAAGRYILYNNLFVNCDYPINLPDASAPQIIYFDNRVRNVTNPPFNGGTADIIEFNINSVDADDFVDPINGNFNLLPTSPAINAAVDYSNIGALDFVVQQSGGVFNPFQQQRIR